MTWWFIEKSVGFTDVGLLRISGSIRAYAYLILSSQASARSSIVGNTASALTAQSAFFNNFENVVNRRVNIQEDIKHYQDTPSYASSKVDYSMGENIYMLPSDMILTSGWELSGTTTKFSYLMENLVWGKMIMLMLALLNQKSRQQFIKWQRSRGVPRKWRNQLSLMMMRKLLQFSFSLVALLYDSCFDKRKHAAQNFM